MSERVRPERWGLAILALSFLLAIGWLVSTWREAELESAEIEARAAAGASAAAAVLEEGFANLTRSEDSRPFYQYAYYYVPADVIAVDDPVAVSPLATGSNDPRVRAHFQLELSGELVMPYAEDETTHRALVAAFVDQHRDALLSVAREGASPEALAAIAQTPEPASAPPSEESSVETTASMEEAAGRAEEEARAREAEASALRRRRARRDRARRNRAAQRELAANSPGVQGASNADNVGAPANGLGAGGLGEAGVGNGPGGVGLGAELAQNNVGNLARQVTIEHARYSNQIVEEIRTAQDNAAPRVRRGRSRLPTRRNVSWEVLNAPFAGEVEQTEAQGSSVRRGRSARRRSRSQRSNAGNRAEAGARNVARAAEEAERLLLGALQATPEEPKQPLVPEGVIRHEVRDEVDYTPFRLMGFGDDAALIRLVEHEDARVLQAVILDTHHLVNTWARGVVEERTGHTLWLSPPGPECVVGVEALESPIAARVCVDAGESPGVSWWQLGALAALFFLGVLAMRQLQLAAGRNRELAAAQGEFISAVSHELRTPITTLRMRSEMLRDGLVRDANLPRVHGQLVRESRRLGDLVDNVLELGRLDSGRHALTLQSVDLARTVERTVVELREAHPSLRIELELSEVQLSGDPSALERIVRNLVENAAKYAVVDGEGEVLIRVGVQEGVAHLRVLDRGPGVPMDELERIFERFHRAGADAGHRPGTGIGLALVRELARAHGGDASASLREGGGLAIDVRLGVSAAS